MDKVVPITLGSRPRPSQDRGSGVSGALALGLQGSSQSGLSLLDPLPGGHDWLRGPRPSLF